MAETVKKSRIVSDEEENLEEALLEEFNLRLKSCMSKDDLHNTEDQLQEDVFVDSPKKNSIIASHNLIESERQHYYEMCAPPVENGSEGQQNGHHNHHHVYETVPEHQEKTEKSDQYVDMTAVTLETTSPEINVAMEDNYEVVEREESPEPPAKSSIKDRLFLSTDTAAATLLFTQTVTSPMLTPSEENIDFLKGFQKEIPTNGSSSPPKEEVEENFYENAEFKSPVTYENLPVENVYENVKETKEEREGEENEATPQPEPEEDLELEEEEEEEEEHIYQDIEDCKRERPYEDVGRPNGDAVVNAEVMVENTLYGVVESNEKLYETISIVTHEKLKIESNETITENHHNHETIAETGTALLDRPITTDLECNNETTYSEFVHHSKSESNYYEKYTEVVTKNSKNTEISNREKDTETVPPEIVKNLKSQFSKTAADEAPKRDVEASNDLKTIDIMKQINKFEQKGSGEDTEDSTVTERYTETTTFQTDVPGEKALKKKKTKKSRKEEKENISVKSSFSKFDALQKKNILHIRSSDSTKAQEKFSENQLADANNCKACSKQVFQMEQIKAERAIWHKNCFRCSECNKQLTVETYVSHEGNLYCKPHFKSLFAPKVVEDDTPPSDKPDLGLEELQSLNVKERFQVFEQHKTQETQEIERGPTPVKRSSSILSKLAKFQAKGMDVGVSDDALNGIPIEESSSEGEEEEEEEVPEGEDPTLYKAKKAQREKPFHFTNLNEVKNKWEQGEQNSRDERREERKQEIQSIRNKLFMGKQGKMKEAYQQAVIQSESCANIHKSEKIESCDTKSLKERFEKGEPFNERENQKNEEEEEVFQSEISKKSRSLFLELDANASKAPQISPVATQKLDVKKAREAYLAKTATEDTVKSSEVVEDVIEVKTADIQQRFKFFETYKEPQKQRKQFRITPPRDPSQVKTGTPEREIYHDPEIVRAEDYIDDSVIAKTTHTASKMLNKFRQMEENLSKEPEPMGPKPLKRFTPPPEPTKPETSEEESGSEEEEEEEDADDQTDNQKLPQDLIEAQKAARARHLRAKFEKWEAEEIKREQRESINIMEEYGEESQVESAKSLRDRFESMKESPADKSRSAPRVKVNRFV